MGLLGYRHEKGSRSCGRGTFWSTQFAPGNGRHSVGRCRTHSTPRLDELSGRASYSGTLIGYADDEPVHGDADLSINFNRGTGEARFHRIADWDGNSWNRSGYRYDLGLYGHYFDSTIDSQDQDGIPDVVGAFYGFEAETAAGTLQRPEITAAFGAVK